MTADEERGWALRLLHSELKPLIETRGYGILAQAVFFLLTAVGVLAFFAFTRAEIVTAVLCIALAEVLMLWRKWFFTGVEAALWLGGLLAALMALPSSGKPEAQLLIALCFAIAGVRVRQPLFGGVAAFIITNYLEVRLDLGTIAALAIAAAALAALHRQWRRPSTEWLFVVLVVAMPVAAAAHSDREWKGMTLALSAAFAVIAFACALRKRHHGMFAGSAVALAVACVKLHELLAPAEELSLAVAGALLLAGSLVVSRMLRGRTHGLVLTPVDLTDIGEAIETIGTLALQPPARSAGDPPEGRPQDGGGFGGAGATGDWPAGTGRN